RSHFPFLAEAAVTHPYQLFYLVWKLSYLFGRAQSDHSLALEQLVASPEVELRRLFAAANVDPATQDVDGLLKLIEKPRFGKWKEYAPEEWFRRHEEQCERTLADFFQAPPPATADTPCAVVRRSFETTRPPLVSTEG